MTIKKFSLGKHILKYGVIFCIIWFIRHFIFAKLELDEPFPLWTDGILNILAIILPIYIYKKKNFGYLKFVDGLKIGNGTSFIVFIFLHVRLVITRINDLNFANNIADERREEMIANNPLFSPNDITETIPNALLIQRGIGVFIFYLMWCFMLTLIITAILYKRKKPDSGI